MERDTLHALIRETQFFQESINSIKKNVDTAKTSVSTISLSISSLSRIKNDSLVRSSSTAHINMEYTRKLLSKVKHFGAKYSRLLDEIKASTESVSTGSLLSIYKEIKEMIGLRNSTPEITEKISVLESHFEILVLTLIDSLPEIIKKDGVISYMKIAKVSINEGGHIKNMNGRKELFSGVCDNSLITCNLDRSRIFEVFLGSIERRFNEHFAPEHNKMIKTDALSFILEDLVLLKETDDLDIPSNYKIFSFSCIQYHRLLYENLDKNSNTFDPNEAIGILLWSKKYYAQMEEMEKPKRVLGPVLFSGREKDLVDKYVKAAEDKLSEWISNLAHMESKRFKERKKAPDLDSENKFISIGFMDLLHIIRQQLEPIYTHPEIFRKVSLHILSCVKNFKKTLTDTIIEELDAVLKDKAHNGFEEYCIALSNSGLKFMDCLHSLSFYSDKNMQLISEVFYECMVSANDALARNISSVIEPAVDNIFTEKWIEEPVTQSIISTYSDYLADYQESMIDYSFTFFVSSLLERTVQMYFDKLCKKRSIFTKDHFSILATDRKKYREFFSKYLAKSVLKEMLKPMDYFISITSSDNVSLCVSEVKMYLKECPHETKERLSRVLRKMPGGNREFSKEVMNRI
ncbi:exocyst complex component 3 [Nematocida minor]|uniref:exocyst complex component 3 n=1 Tax=Nematocida minor TaxID=1912983 RepID=UPI00221F0D4B|nr:exocyst complex component 3 [Nematocida minor]KAI5189449.1 exocyst complex component 3 [Nematocida minor]